MDEPQFIQLGPHRCILMLLPHLWLLHMISQPFFVPLATVSAAVCNMLMSRDGVKPLVCKKAPIFNRFCKSPVLYAIIDSRIGSEFILAEFFQKLVLWCHCDIRT